MAYEQQRRDIVTRLLDREQIEGVVEPRVPPAAKYKKEGSADRGRPDLFPGRKLIVEIYDPGAVEWKPRGTKGYALCVVLDYEEQGGYWHRTDVIVQVTCVSHPDLEPMVGRLKVFKVLTPRMGTRRILFVPEEANPADFHLV
jgi:hypothetical protein